MKHRGHRRLTTVAADDSADCAGRSSLGQHARSRRSRTCTFDGSARNRQAGVGTQYHAELPVEAILTMRTTSRTPHSMTDGLRIVAIFLVETLAVNASVLVSIVSAICRRQCLDTGRFDSWAQLSSQD